MNGYSYYVIGIEENGKHYATAERVANQNNLLAVFSKYRNASTVNACETMKEAKEIANFWNACYEKNGTYAFA